MSTEESTNCQPGDVVRTRAGRTGHIVRVVEPPFANTVCGELLIWSKLAPIGTPGEVSWIAPAGTPLCRLCLRKVSTAKARRLTPDLVKRCSFGQPIVPTHVPAVTR